jgi:hypothetical protein
MDSQGRVMDSSKVEAGSGQMDGDLNRQGVDSFYFGSDRHRYEMAFKGHTRLFFCRWLHR